MFEKANRIISDDNFGSAPIVYFKDLNIIYPLRRAVLNITAKGEYKIFVGKDKVGEGNSPATYDSYDITELVAESDFLYICVFSDGKTKDCGAFAVQVDLEFAGDLTGVIVTDESWTSYCESLSQSDIDSGKVFDFEMLSGYTGKVKTIQE